MTIFSTIAAFYGIMTVIGFISMWRDKRKAQQHAWRTPEATLLMIAFLGGALGTLLAMQLVRHKTRTAKFQLFVPLAILLHATLWILWIRS
ncbi:DUF1294 domain-containing protein [Exiguobacterium sp. s138]|uniref:DUF1294 domain-containing protein n=1 Tax=Exiguobacterium sp. s138 TaxID=2751202 RepID=UPI001BE53E73|nr:DUF1294 domain-containing protein [Exiguobacterium sp. s138]